MTINLCIEALGIPKDKELSILVNSSNPDDRNPTTSPDTFYRSRDDESYHPDDKSNGMYNLSYLTLAPNFENILGEIVIHRTFLFEKISSTSDFLRWLLSGIAHELYYVSKYSTTPKVLTDDEKLQIEKDALLFATMIDLHLTQLQNLE